MAQAVRKDDGPGVGDVHVPVPGRKPRDKTGAEVMKSAPAPLYVYRRLLNADAVIAWAKAQGIATTLPADEMHVTVLYSKTPVDWMAMGEDWSPDKDGKLIVQPGGPRVVSQFNGGATVLEFACSWLKYRHEAMLERGATSDFPDYKSHITLTYNGADLDVSKIEPYQGELVFGPEVFEEIRAGFDPSNIVEEAAVDLLQGLRGERGPGPGVRLGDHLHQGRAALLRHPEEPDPRRGHGARHHGLHEEQPGGRRDARAPAEGRLHRAQLPADGGDRQGDGDHLRPDGLDDRHGAGAGRVGEVRQRRVHRLLHRRRTHRDRRQARRGGCLMAVAGVMTKFRIDELSAVDVPAQTGARKAIMKRNSANHGGEADHGHQSEDQGATMTPEIKKALGLADTATDAEVLAAVTKAATAGSEASAAALEKANAELKIAKAKATLSDKEKQLMDGKTDEEVCKFADLTAEQRAAEVAKAAAGDETVEIEGRTISKRAVGDDMFAVMKSQAKRIDDAAAAIVKANDERETAVFAKRASDEFPHLAGTVDERAAVLKAISKMDETTKASAEAILKAAEGAAKFAFSRRGAGGGDGGSDTDTAEAKLNKKAKDIEKANSGLSFAKAYERACEENPDLYEEASTSKT
jgi:hypothetical protein